MRNTHWVAAAVLGIIVGGCASTQTSPTAETRQAVAPTGKLRVGMFALNPIHAIKDPASGEFKGPAVDLGKELARRIGVPFEAVPYTTIGALLAGAKSGEWDVATMGISAEREQLVDFTAPFMVVEYGYVVPASSSISTSADIDRKGIRIAVAEKGAPDAFLTKALKQATLVRLPALPQMMQSLRAGNVEAVYGVRAAILGQSEKFPGSRVIEDRLGGGEQTAIAFPKGRAGVAYVHQFVENAKSEGLVKAAIDRAALRGVVVAPTK
jgi:polar amino acid transport system substrate-binding protein